jgi:hypothetical protein
MRGEKPMRFAFADPPYPGMSGYYRQHPDYAGEVNHAELIERLECDFDGWLLHTASTTLREVLPLCPEGVRVFSWVKTFASFKPSVCPAYAWEPVIVRQLRKPTPNQIVGSEIMRDWFAEPITMKRGLTGAKPERVCHWLFEACGLRPDDDLHDLFPGSGAVTDAWDSWRAAPRLEAA